MSSAPEPTRSCGRRTRGSRELNYALELTRSSWEPPGLRTRSRRRRARAAVVPGPDSRVLSASASFFGLFGTSAPRTLGQRFLRVGGGTLGHRLSSAMRFRGCLCGRWRGLSRISSSTARLPRLGRRTMVLSGRRMQLSELGEHENVLLAIDDITERAQAEALSDALDQINLVMISTVDYDELLDRAMTEAAQGLFGVTRPCSWSRSTARGESQDFSAGADLGKSGRGRSRRGGSQAVLEPCAIGQRAIVSTSSLEIRGACCSSIDAGTQRGACATQVSGRCGRSLQFRPLRLRGGRFTDAELDFIDKLAPALSMALENAEGCTRDEHRIAEVLQTSLLKPIAPVAGLEVGVAYVPAFEPEKVGGDSTTSCP